MNGGFRMAEYNGWKNRQTWSCALWIGNDEPLYRAAAAFMKNYKGRSPYASFIKHEGMTDEKNPDGIKWISTRISYDELNEFMNELRRV